MLTSSCTSRSLPHYIHITVYFDECFACTLRSSSEDICSCDGLALLVLEVRRLTKYFKWISTVHRNTQDFLFSKWDVFGNGRCRGGDDLQLMKSGIRPLSLFSAGDMEADFSRDYFRLILVQLIDEVKPLFWMAGLASTLRRFCSYFPYRCGHDASYHVEANRASFAVTKEFRTSMGAEKCFELWLLRAVQG